MKSLILLIFCSVFAPTYIYANAYEEPDSMVDFSFGLGASVHSSLIKSVNFLIQSYFNCFGSYPTKEYLLRILKPDYESETMQFYEENRCPIQNYIELIIESKLAFDHFKKDALFLVLKEYLQRKRTLFLKKVNTLSFLGSLQDSALKTSKRLLEHKNEMYEYLPELGQHERFEKHSCNAVRLYEALTIQQQKKIKVIFEELGINRKKMRRSQRQ